MKKTKVSELSSASENQAHQNHQTQNIQTQANHKENLERKVITKNYKKISKGGLKAYLNTLKQVAP